MSIDTISRQFREGTISFLDFLSGLGRKVPDLEDVFLTIREAIAKEDVRTLSAAKHVMLNNAHFIEVDGVQGDLSNYRSPAFWPSRDNPKYMAYVSDLEGARHSRLWAVVDLGIMTEGEDRSLSKDFLEARKFIADHI